MVVAYGRLDDLAGDPEGHGALPDGVPRARGTLLEEQKAAPCNLWLDVPYSRVARSALRYSRLSL